MKQIVVDLELTQVGDRTPRIVQIGACLIDTKALKMKDTFDIICKPNDPLDRVEGLGEISTYQGSSTITKLTGITSEMVEQGVPISEALEMWWKWVEQSGAGFRVADWGFGDITTLQQSSKQNQVEIPKRVKGLDLKQMFGPIRQMKDAKARGGLKNTLDLFGLEFIGTQHNALDDAKSTAYLYLDFLSKVRKTFEIENKLKFDNKLRSEFE